MLSRLISGRHVLKATVVIVLLVGGAYAPQFMSGATANALATHSKSIRASTARLHPDDFDNCPATYACGFADANFKLGPGKWQDTNPNFNDFSSDGACYYPGTAGMYNNGSWNDCISSVVNNLSSNETIYWYPNAHCAGDDLALGDGVAFSDLAAHYQSNGNSWNDVISSDAVGSRLSSC